MSTILKITNLGSMGVNVDSDPLSLEDQELRLAQNAIRDPIGNDSGLTKRPGFVVFNTNSSAGATLGGIGLPVQDMSGSGTHYIYIGRGPTS